MSSTKVKPAADGKKSKDSQWQQQMLNDEVHVPKRTVMDELLVHDHHHHHHHKFVLHPYGIRRYWDVVTTLAVLYLCWRIPFDLGIDWWYPPQGLKDFELFLDIWFGVDIVLNFRTGFVHDGHLVMEPKAIAKHYLEFWFWIDIIATIPFEIFGALFESKSSRKAIKLVKWFKIPRLMRLGRVVKYLRQYAKFYSLILIVGGIILCTHMFGCVFIAIVQPCAQYSYDKTTYWDDSKYGPCAQDKAFEVWARALHYGMAILLGNSVRALDADDDAREYGGLELKHNAASDVVCCLMMLIGLWLMSLFFGEIAVIAHHSDRYGWDFRVRHKRIQQAMSLHGLPSALQGRVNKFYDYLWLNQLYGSNPLLEDPDMSEPLKKDICLYMYKDVLKSVPFLSQASADVVNQLCSLLKLQVFMPGEYIFHIGDRGRSLYIVMRGKCEVLDRENNVVAELGQHSFFGETALLKGIGKGYGGKRSCSVRAITISNMLQLSTASFNMIVKEFPSFRQEMLALSARRVAKRGRKSYGNLKGAINSEELAALDNSINSPSTSAKTQVFSFESQTSAASGPSNGGERSKDEIIADLRKCIAEMKVSIEHSINDRLAGLEARMDDTVTRGRDLAV